MNFSFPKQERLKSRKAIQTLFAGKAASVAAYPVRVIWTPMPEKRSESAIQVTFSVPKRKFKKAVERNLLKRRMREAYRLQKHDLAKAFPETDTQWALMFLFTGTEITDYKTIESSIKRICRKVKKHFFDQGVVNSY